MTDQELQKLSRLELLEILVKQQERIEELETQLEETTDKLKSREIKLSRAGSIADAALEITDIFEKAQEAADLYLENVKRNADALVQYSVRGDKRPKADARKAMPGPEYAEPEEKGRVDEAKADGGDFWLD